MVPVYTADSALDELRQLAQQQAALGTGRVIGVIGTGFAAADHLDDGR